VVYFYVGFTQTAGNTYALNFANITYDSGSGPSYLLSGSSVSASGTQATLTVNNAQQYFSLYLTGLVFESVSSLASYTFTAQIQVTFNGNRKRTLDVSWEQPATTQQEQSQVVARTRIQMHKDRVSPACTPAVANTANAHHAASSIALDNNHMIVSKISAYITLAVSALVGAAAILVFQKLSR